MSETKLKPCPFCGGEAELIKYKESASGFNDDFAKIKCGCGIEISTTQKELKALEAFFGFNGGYYSSNKELWETMHQKLIDKWNTRKPMDDIVEKLEQQAVQAEKDMQLSDKVEEANAFGGKWIAFDEALNIIIEETKAYNEEVCEHESEYKFISDKYKVETECGYTFYDLHHAEPFKFCPYCGKKIKVVE